MGTTMETKHLTPVERIEQWITALRSGKYQQGRRAIRLQDRFCCLGVMCDVLDPTLWRGNTYAEYGAGLAPDPIDVLFGLTCDDVNTLANMNDNGSSFAAIADYIESTILPRVRREQEGE